MPKSILGRPATIENVVDALAEAPPEVALAVIMHLPTDVIDTSPVVGTTLQPPPLAAYLTGFPSLALADALNAGSPQRFVEIDLMATVTTGTGGIG